MKLTRRGEIVFALLLIAGAGIVGYGLWQVITHLWFVGDHYCWGTMFECYKEGL